MLQQSKCITPWSGALKSTKDAITKPYNNTVLSKVPKKSYLSKSKDIMLFGQREKRPYE